MYSKGSGHVGIIVVAVLALVGLVGFVGYNAVMKKKDGQKADAAGGYAAICGSGYKLMHNSYNTIYNYKNEKGRGCAILASQYPGIARNMSLKVKGGASVSGRYKYHTKPLYYAHKPGVVLMGCFVNDAKTMGSCSEYKLKSW